MSEDESWKNEPHRYELTLVDGSKHPTSNALTYDGLNRAIRTGQTTVVGQGGTEIRVSEVTIKSIAPIIED